MMKFPKRSNSKLAELVGILLGDGSIAIRQYRIQITLNKNELQYAFYITGLIKNLFNIKPNIKFRKKENALDILVFNKQIVYFLINKIGLTVAPKWERAVLPQIYTRDNLNKYVLRGYFDTDGCVAITNNNGTTYPRLEMKICPSPMRNSLIKILRMKKFRFGAYTIENNRTRIQMNGYSQLFKWLKEIGISNPNNLNKIRELIKKELARRGFEPRTSRLVGINQPDLRVSQSSYEPFVE